MILDCPGCNQSYDVSSYRSGQRLRCRCGQIIVVPGRGPEIRAARTIHCNNCGGTLKKGEPICPFCNALVDLTSTRLTAYCPHCLSMSKEGAKFCSGCGKVLTKNLVSPEETDEQCPRCKIRMRRRVVGKHKPLECPACCGLFVEVEMLEEIIREQEERIAEVASATSGPERASMNAEPVAYLKCPVCKTIMNRLNYGRFSGVLVDYCRKHGYWLDEGELEKIAKWVATGGLAKKYAQEAEDAKSKAEAARKELEAVKASMLMTGDDLSFSRSRRAFGVESLFEIAIKLFNK